VFDKKAEVPAYEKVLDDEDIPEDSANGSMFVKPANGAIALAD